MQCIFEKNISAIKVADGDSTDYQAKLNAQYVAFLKEKHPEYYRDWVRGDNSDLESKIQVHSKLAWYFQTEKSALGSRAAEVALCRKNAEQDPKNYLPAVEVDEFRFKN